MGRPLPPLPHEFRTRGLRLIATPPGNSTFRVAPERPIVAVTLAPMACGIAIGGDRLRKRRIAAQSVCVLPAGATFSVDGVSAAWAALLEVDPSFCGLEAFASLDRPVDFEPDRTCGAATAQAVRQVVEPVPDEVRLQEHVADMALAALARAGHPHADLDGGVLTPPKVRRTMERIRADVGGVPSLEDLARDVGISVTHLGRQFRRATGSSLWDFVTYERCRKARSLLMAGDMPLAQIALECGFHDQAHMTHAVKQKLGTTPGALRTAHGQILQ